jgi:hypothetical protein
MSDIKKKTVVGDFRTIKLAIFLSVLALTGFFIAGGVEAITFTETFDTYTTGNLTGQGGWETPYGNQSCWVDNIEAYSTPYSISVIDNYASCGGQKEWATTTEGYFTFNFYGKTKETGTNLLIFFNTSILQLTNSVIYVGGEALPNSNWNTEFWNTVGIEYNTEEEWIRGRFNLNEWSATSTFAGPFTMVNFIYQNAFRNEQDFFLDNLKLVGSYSDYTYEQLGLPELPELEVCTGYGLTERILCEIKNFFYRLFVPSPEKVSEIKDTLELIKTKFPYNYILEIKDFFEYLKDSIDEDQGIDFSILGNSGTVNLEFWNSTTTVAGVGQSFLTIFKTFTRFLLILIFGLWCFSFIKRIFK